MKVSEQFKLCYYFNIFLHFFVCWNELIQVETSNVWISGRNSGFSVVLCSKLFIFTKILTGYGPQNFFLKIRRSTTDLSQNFQQKVLSWVQMMRWEHIKIKLTEKCVLNNSQDLSSSTMHSWNEHFLTVILLKKSFFLCHWSDSYLIFSALSLYKNWMYLSQDLQYIPKIQS